MENIPVVTNDFSKRKTALAGVAVPCTAVVFLFGFDNRGVDSEGRRRDVEAMADGRSWSVLRCDLEPTGLLVVASLRMLEP